MMIARKLFLVISFCFLGLSIGSSNAYSYPVPDQQSEFLNYIRNGNITQINDLLGQGVDVNVVIEEDNNITALHLAAQTGNIEVVRLLLARGADSSRVDGRGHKPFHTAAYYGHMEISSLLAKHLSILEKQRNNPYMSPLHKAVEAKHYEIVKLLVIKGANVEARNHKGETVIHTAARIGSHDIVTLLLEKRAKLNVTNDYGETPLHAAVESGNSDIVMALLQSGSDIEANDKHGETPLHLAVSDGNTEIVSLLLDKGANPNSSN